MSKETTETDRLVRAGRELLDFIDLVFDHDWDHTLGCLSDEYRQYFIDPDGTFLQPNVSDESNNWANRGAFLAAYRRAKEEFALDDSPEAGDEQAT